MNKKDIVCLPSSQTLTQSVSHIPATLLRNLLKAIDSNCVVTSQTPELVEYFVKQTEYSGADLFVQQLQEETVHESCSWLDIGANNELLSELSGALLAKIKEKGIVAFVESMTIEILRRYCADVGIESANLQKKDVEEQIKEEVMLLGLEEVLAKLTLGFLKEICEVLQITVDKKGLKKELIEKIVLEMYRESPAPFIKQETTPPHTPTRPVVGPISYNTPKKDLMQMYVKDLKEYLKNNGLKYDDKKSVLVSRVLRHFKRGGEAGSEDPPTPIQNTGSDAGLEGTSDEEEESTVVIEELREQIITDSNGNHKENGTTLRLEQLVIEKKIEQPNLEDHLFGTNNIAAPIQIRPKRRKTSPDAGDEGSGSEDELSQVKKKKIRNN